MKKAKIVLSAVALFAVVGGALAFKANRSTFAYFTKLNPAATICTVEAETLTTAPGRGVYTTLYTNTTCGTSTYYTTAIEN